MEVLLMLTMGVMMLTMGVMNILCFLVGARVGQKVVKGEEVVIPTANPLKAVREREAKREALSEQERIDTIMRNVENYDGTSNGQEDVPRR